MKNKYESTKPIRGRAVDTRPWNDRRRDAELIVQTTRVMDGVVTYGAKLHDTVVFEVDPKGMLTFRCDGWVSPTTVKFLGLVMRQLDLGGACQRFNNIWIHLHRDMVEKHFWLRVPRSGTTDVFYNPDTDKYELPEQYVTKRTVDTIKMKELRAKVKGFQKYYRSLLKLSDGVVTAQFKADNVVARSEPRSFDVVDHVPVVLEGYDEPQAIAVSRYFRLSFMGDETHRVLFQALIEGNEENYAPMLTWFAYVADMVGEGQLEDVTYSNGVQGKTVTHAINVQQIDRMVTKIIKDVGNAYVYTRVRITEPMKDDGSRA
jgi:hypothetical protein